MKRERYMMWAAFAWAQPASGGSGDTVPFWTSLLPFMLILILFYLLLILPQQKKAKKHREILSGLKKGDKVVTSGGIYGRVSGISKDVVILEVADNVRMKVKKESIAELRGEGEAE